MLEVIHQVGYESDNALENRLPNTNRSAIRLWEEGLIRSDEYVFQHWVDGEMQFRRLVDQRYIGTKTTLGPHQKLRFHPFRILVLEKVLEFEKGSRGWSEFLQTRTSRKDRQKFRNLRESISQRSLVAAARYLNGVADLAIALEPIYWPDITHVRSERGWFTGGKAEREQVMKSYRSEILEVVRSIPFEDLVRAHEFVRVHAYHHDPNGELYLFLRALPWNVREKLEGSVGLSLWLRHIAEVLRLGIEQAHEPDVRLEHEDSRRERAVAEDGQFYGARKWLFGSQFPIDNPKEAQKRILGRWGANSTPLVRFYVEGHTEEAALRWILGASIGYDVEVVNLEAKFGKSKNGKEKEEVYFGPLLTEVKLDLEARRLSYIMFDGDNADNVRIVKALAKNERIVGMVFKNYPDFEFGAFTVEQLARAIEIFEENQFLPLIAADDISQLKSGGELVKWYLKLHRCGSLKGTKWGEALAQVAWESTTSLSDESHILVHAAACAWRGTNTDYDSLQRCFRIDPETLKQVKTDEEPY